ncbi:restriction endonuclease subunit S [Pseudopontixanthobacter vadosimaris]|uniref:restriction endonuclease subunit S n=1 Tax=Pseudopontixanthobacter vadosimaris TaxID=2726450 RepID=UPI00147570C1
MSWRQSTLGELCKLYQPEIITKKEMKPDGKYPVFGANGVIGRYHRFNHAEPQLVIGCRGACGTVHITQPESWITGNSMVIQPKDDTVDLRFLRYYFEGPADLGAAISGAAQPQITQGSLKPILVPLPPMDEQKRIVAVLDQAFAALDRARANAEANLADAEEFLASFMEAELRKSGGEILTLQQMLDSGLIVSHLDGNHGSNYPRKAEFVESGVAYVSANCIVEGQIDLGKAKFLTHERAATIKKGVARNGDVIFAHNATVGPVALLETEEDKVILSTSVTYYRPDQERILPEFLMYEMRSSAFRRQYEGIMGQATRNQVPITAQRKLTHTIPNLKAQSELVAACSEIETNSRGLNLAYAAALADLDDLRQSILKKAFAGELT